MVERCKMAFGFVVQCLFPQVIQLFGEMLFVEQAGQQIFAAEALGFLFQLQSTWGRRDQLDKASRRQVAPEKLQYDVEFGIVTFAPCN